MAKNKPKAVVHSLAELAAFQKAGVIRSDTANTKKENKSHQSVKGK